MKKRIIISLFLSLAISTLCSAKIRIETFSVRHLGEFYDETGFLSQAKLDSLELLGFDYTSYSRSVRPKIIISNILIYGGLGLCVAGGYIENAYGYPDGDSIQYNKKSLSMFIPGAISVIAGLFWKKAIVKNVEIEVNSLLTNNYALAFSITF